MTRWFLRLILVLLIDSPSVSAQQSQQQTTLLLQRIQFSDSSRAKGPGAIPFTIASPVLNTSFKTSSFVAPSGPTRLKDLVPDSERPRTEGLVASSAWLKGQFFTEGEVANNSTSEWSAVSRIDRREDASTRMVRFALSGMTQQFRYGANYRSAGKAFFNTPDQTIRELWGETQWGITKFRGVVGEMWNNVDLDPSLSRTEQRYSRIGLALAKPSWPEFSVTYARNSSIDSIVPIGWLPQRTRSNSIEGALAYNGLNWNARLASSYIVVVDDLRASAETVALAQSISGLYRPINTLTIMPVLTYRTERQESSRVGTIQTPMASLSLQFKQSQRLLVSAIGGYTSSKSSDRTTNSESIVSRGMFAFHLDPIYGRTAMLSLEAAYTNSRYRSSPALDTEDISGLLRFLIASL
ncbi:MAG TPA: hypothetical protein VJ805_06605 [Nitrospiraceae bacterium]|nr:hypothetical protein [Nitrospiraceae bacterium]